MSASPSYVFLVFKSIYTVLCTEHVIYLYQTLALIITALHEGTSGQEANHTELSETVMIHFDMFRFYLWSRLFVEVGHSVKCKECIGLLFFGVCVCVLV